MTFKSNWRCSIVQLLLVFGFHAEALSATANSFQAEQLRSVLANPNSRYALVTRPSDTTRLAVDLLELDPVARKPTSRLPTPLSCNRVHASAQGLIFCFSRVPPGSTQAAGDPVGYVFSRSFELQKTNEARSGIVSRARISADGKYTASTAFVTGHSYLSGPGEFSTATFIGTAKGNAAEQDLQTWQITRDGKPFNPPDINLWGVTFDPRDSNLFFVTVHGDGDAFLGKGNVSKRSIEIMLRGIECPSLSPDGSKLAFKRKMSSMRWVPALLDLATGNETIYASVPNSVDDQIEWLDNTTLIYEVTTTPLLGKPRTDLMTLDTRTTTASQQIWLPDARSPTFIGSR